MNISVEIVSHEVLRVRYRAEDEGMIGDGVVELREGDDFLGITFERLMQLGDGVYETDDIEEEQR